MINIVIFSILAAITGFLNLSIQLILGKSLLPLMGGSPNVWIACLAFFQASLTIGYALAVLNQKIQTNKHQIWFYCVLLALAIFSYPVLLGSTEQYENKSVEMLSILFKSVFYAYLFLSFLSPSLQYWFLKLSQKEPYFLYSFSNFGTVVSLLSYPFIVEYFLNVQEQFEFWNYLFLLCIFMSAIVFLKQYKLSKNRIVITKTELGKTKILPKTYGYWIMMALLPSAFLSLSSFKMTTDVASMPLLWIIPLLVYFLSFILVFSKKSWVSCIVEHKKFSSAGILLIMIGFIFSVLPVNFNFLLTLTVWMLALFVVSMHCHYYLLKSSPDLENITIFYLMMSLGGCLGGLMMGVLFPLIFNDFYEQYFIYFLLLIVFLSKTQKPNFFEPTNQKKNINSVVCFIILIFFMTTITYFIFQKMNSVFLVIVIFLIMLISEFGFSKKQNVFLYTLILISSALVIKTSNLSIIYKERTFFGIYKVTQKREEKNNQTFNILVHGTTVHGFQIKEIPEKTNAYYIPRGPMSTSIQDFRQSRQSPIKAAMIGLGTGTTACFFNKIDTVNFFEIDEAVVNIAKNEQFFTYLKLCPVESIIIGDARKEIEKRSQKYDIILIDAFTSDAIPSHLITKEAVISYQNKLNQDGAIIFHLSNRHLDLSPVIKKISDNINLQSKVCNFLKPEKDLTGESSVVVVVSQNIGFLREDCWKDMNTVNQKIWTDQFSTLLPYFK